MRASLRVWVVRFASRLISHVVAVALAVLISFASSSASAQGTYDGALGWDAPIPGGGVDYWPSAYQACLTQYNRFMGAYTYQKWFLGYKNTKYWYTKACDWQGTALGWAYPAPTTFHCQSGYKGVEPGICRKDDLTTSSTCSVNHGGLPNPVHSHPIEMLTGSKIFRRTDFASGDGALELSRWFTSGGFGGMGLSSYVSQAPVGFANWRASWAIQLTITDYSNPTWVVTLPSGRVVAFVQSGGIFTPLNDYSWPLPSSDVKLAFVGNWPSSYSYSSMISGPTTWTVTDEEDNVWTLQTHIAPELGNYSVALPIRMVDRNGFVRIFSYGQSGELTAIYDSAGKTINFVWLYSDPSTLGITGRTKYPVAISEADLPDGSKILYSYTTNGQPTTGLIWPDVLTKVEFHDAAGVLQDSETYNYGDSRFPWYVTDVIDKNGVTRWSVTYDSAGRAVTSQGPGGAFGYSVAYTPLASTFTRTVTDALGKQTIYQFAQVNGADAKLTSVNGQASTHCVASNSSYTYDSNPFVTGATDEEGRVTAYTRNSRGLPTQITEAQGTSSVRTTNITWHSALSVPTQVVEAGRTTTYAYADGAVADPTSITLPAPSGADPSTPHAYWRVLIGSVNGAGTALVTNLYMFGQAGGDDLAVGGTALSSATSGGAATQAFDHDPSTAWQASQAGGAWLGYHFSAPVAVRFVGLMATYSDGSSASAPNSFGVQYSDDGANWSTLWNVTSQTAWSSNEVRWFTGPSFTYTSSLHGARTKWRVRLLTSGSNAYSATEVQFRATPGGASQASGGTPFATENYNCSSSTGCTYSSDKAFDGSTSTLWSSNDANAGQVLQYTFPSAVSVAELGWTARTDCCQAQSPTSAVVEYWSNAISAWISAWKYSTSVFTSGQSKTFTDPAYIAP